MTSFSGLRTVAFVPKLKKSLCDAVAVAGRRSGRAGAMVASMVAAPAVRGTDVEFHTETFTKEKITPAGRDEVGFSVMYNLNFAMEGVLPIF